MGFCLLPAENGVQAFKKNGKGKTGLAKRHFIVLLCFAFKPQYPLETVIQ